MRFREYAEAGTEFGRLMLRGGVTPAQHEAGERFAELTKALQAVYDAAGPNPQAMNLTRSAGFPGPGMTSAQGQAIKDRYAKAFECAGEAGNKAQRTIAPHVILDKPVADFTTLNLLKNALDKLVKHFGIDRNLQISHVRNTR